VPTGRSAPRSVVPAKGVQLVVATCGLLAFLAATTHDVWPMALACGLGAAIFVCWLSCRLTPVPTVTITLEQPLTVGMTAITTVAVVNSFRSSTRPCLVSHLTDVPHHSDHPLLSPARWYIAAMQPGAQTVARLPRTPVQRGHLPSSSLELETPGIFGLFSCRSRFVVPDEILVEPAQVRAPPLPPLAGGTHGSRGTPSGDELRGVREWRTGDSPRDVHWRSTARTGALAVVERGEPESGELLVIAVGSWGDPAYEQSLAAAAATARQALARQCPVWLMIKPISSAPPALQPVEEHTVGQVFARLGSTEPLGRTDLGYLTRAIQPGAGVLLAATTGLYAHEPGSHWQDQLREAVGAAGGVFLGRADP
jgi:uncharacterized protein (DUF58 family)